MTREEVTHSRRNFLKTAAITAVAATAAGAGAAKLSSTSQTAPTVIDTAPVIVPQAQAVLTGSEDLAELFSKLAAAQAENEPWACICSCGVCRTMKPASLSRSRAPTRRQSPLLAILGFAETRDPTRLPLAAKQ